MSLNPEKLVVLMAAMFDTAYSDANLCGIASGAIDAAREQGLAPPREETFSRAMDFNRRAFHDPRQLIAWIAAAADLAEANESQTPAIAHILRTLMDAARESGLVPLEMPGWVREHLRDKIN